MDPPYYAWIRDSFSVREKVLKPQAAQAQYESFFINTIVVFD